MPAAQRRCGPRAPSLRAPAVVAHLSKTSTQRKRSQTVRSLRLYPAVYRDILLDLRDRNR
jgi:hypothetical protein